MNDVEDRVRAALAARAAVTEPSYDAPDEFAERLGRARKHRRHRMLTIAAGVIVVLAIALPVTLQRNGRDSGAPPAAPVILHPPSPGPSASRHGTRVTAAPPVLPDHPFFAGMLTGGQTAVFDAQSGRRTLSIAATVPRAEAVAGRAGHGWLVAQKAADGCHSELVPATVDGTASVPLVSPRPALIDEIMVSPDGRRLAAVERTCASPGTVDVLVIDLLTGRQHRWVSPGPGITAVNGLTWSADGTRLAYTSGVNTGAGLGGGYTELDATTAGGTLSGVLPGTGQVEIDGKRCQVDRGLWLGTTGRFAVFAYCPGSDDLFLAQVPFGATAPRGQVIASLPGESGTLFPDASVTNDGRHVLLTTGDATYRIDDGKVFRLDGPWRSPSW